EAVDGAQEPLLPPVVEERLAHLRDKPGEARLRHEAVRPQAPLDLHLRDRLRPALQEQLEQLESLGLQVHGRAAVEELAGGGVEDELGEGDAHQGPRKSWAKARESPRTLPGRAPIFRSGT